eukprot:TRINITY_DN17807_c0_g1_i2.p1 TRINITY_DN17807_c0_g1~~TRINITY_DN17807_c0_g1_i2.p1  ORF type:complete len:111 (+),score=5.52 TRINITY_DN17807_c0_g1_i2:22-354(+)
MSIGKWQGRLDSNQRMAGSKPAALPLGDAPVSVAANAHALDFLTRLCSLRCNIETLLPFATNPVRVSVRRAETLSASALFGKPPNTQLPVPVNFASVNLPNKFKALRTSG